MLAPKEIQFSLTAHIRPNEAFPGPSPGVIKRSAAVRGLAAWQRDVIIVGRRIGNPPMLVLSYRSF